MSPIDPDVYRAAISQTVPLFGFLDERYAEVERWAENAPDGHPAQLLRKAMGRLDDALVVFEDTVGMALLEAALE